MFITIKHIKNNNNDTQPKENRPCNSEIFLITAKTNVKKIYYRNHSLAQ